MATLVVSDKKGCLCVLGKLGLRCFVGFFGAGVQSRPFDALCVLFAEGALCPLTPIASKQTRAYQTRGDVHG